MQKLIANKGDPHADVWVVVEKPFKQDSDKGYLFSGSYGYIYDRMLRDAGITDYFVTCRKPDPADAYVCRIVENDINHYRPPIIIPIEEAGKFLLDKLNVKYTKAHKQSEEKISAIEKYCGSLLHSDRLNYEHYCIPSFSPETVSRDWSMRDIVVSIDLSRAKDELDFFRRYGYLQPLFSRILEFNFESSDEFDRLLLIIEERFMHASRVSNDIETIYPKKYANKPSIFLGRHPGYPLTVGLSDNKNYGISFNLFREKKSETKRLWRALDRLFRNVKQLGQNFHNFDQNYYEMLGFEFNFEPEDTMIRHHILWPELSHKLQFMTRQYTREVYYKDEGHNWSIKDLNGLKRYNCLDVCVTMEIYEEQEKEFDARPHLR